MSRYKPTKHALARASSRLGLGDKFNTSKYLKDAVNHGRPIGDFKDAFYEYLMQIKYAKKSRGISIRVYQNTAVVYNKRSGKIITTYKVPQRFLPTKNYLHTSIYNRRYKDESTRDNNGRQEDNSSLQKFSKQSDNSIKDKSESSLQ